MNIFCRSGTFSAGCIRRSGNGSVTGTTFLFIATEVQFHEMCRVGAHVLVCSGGIGIFK